MNSRSLGCLFLAARSAPAEPTKQIFGTFAFFFCSVDEFKNIKLDLMSGWNEAECAHSCLLQ